MDWSQKFSKRTETLGNSVIREILKLTQQPNVISFAGGLPAPELFPVDAINEVSTRILQKKGQSALQYSVTEGYPPLRRYIADRMRTDWGIELSVDNVRILSGSQQGLDLIGKTLINKDDDVIVGEPAYLGAMQAWKIYEPNWVTVPVDNEGIYVQAIQDKLDTGVGKLVYSVPTFQNPSGVTMSVERRQQLVALAQKHDLILVEDNPYGNLRFDGEHKPPLIAVDAHTSDNHVDSGNTIYMGSFSKTLAPGLRVGFVVGPTPILAKMTSAKQGDDVHTSTFSQMICYELAHSGFIDEHVQTINEVYKERRDIMLGLIEELFPPGIQWTRPEGGMFTWITLPESINSVQLLEKAVEKNVAFVPGYAFYARGGGENTFRLNFSNAKPEHIEKGMHRLAKVIKEELMTVG